MTYNTIPAPPAGMIGEEGVTNKNARWLMLKTVSMSSDGRTLIDFPMSSDSPFKTSIIGIQININTGMKTMNPWNHWKYAKVN